MCFDHDSRPPIAPIAGGALDSELGVLSAADGNRFAAYRARPSEPTGAAVLILPDVRGLHPYYEELALRFAEHGIDALAIDYFGRTAGAESRGEDFDYPPHVALTTWAGISADITAGIGAIRAASGGSGQPAAVFTIGFCMGGRMSFLAATLGLGLSGVIGLYGTLVGAWRNDAPAPVDVTDRFAAPVLGLFGGADAAITPEAIAVFDAGLTEADVEHRLVTYPGAPHSFFDRKAAEFADASAAAWDETLAFIGSDRRWRSGPGDHPGAQVAWLDDGHPTG
jgi:carboxymethylenebutenolidase